ncbi:hypothetical protein [Parvicella tangerina]|uniref:Uncharacterized protein n=1 Tax=Parvicella tangerina TaxID=2829795 RepID=A0A916JN57_9FLAO|nr:hypothetical protein [Parvicella tangerina]CAG5082216.1 hypothetical protein CRYO30217_01843 [Parvicella tangerina]
MMTKLVKYIITVLVFLNTQSVSAQLRSVKETAINEVEICLIPFQLKLKVEPLLDSVIHNSEKFCERSNYKLIFNEFDDDIKTREDFVSYFTEASLLKNHDKYLIRGRVVISYLDTDVNDVLLLDQNGYIYFRDKWYQNGQILDFLLGNFSKKVIEY